MVSSLYRPCTTVYRKKYGAGFNSSSEIEIAHLKDLINLKRENTSVGINAILQYTIGKFPAGTVGVQITSYVVGSLTAEIELKS